MCSDGQGYVNLTFRTLFVNSSSWHFLTQESKKQVELIEQFLILRAYENEIEKKTLSGVFSNQAVELSFHSEINFTYVQFEIVVHSFCMFGVELK